MAGRLLVWAAPEAIAAAVDIAFLPVVALVLLRVLVHAKNRHNIFLPVALGMLAVLNVLFHLWAAQGRSELALRSSYLAVGILVMFVTIIGGRVIPSFTMNAIPGFLIRRWGAIEALVIPFSVVAFVLDALNAPWWSVTTAAWTAAIVHMIRIGGWRSWRVGYRPILSILHIAYAWIPAGFLLLGLSSLDLVAHTVAIHAFTVGAVGCAIVAMITRTALGHTGRPLVAGIAECLCYGLVIAAALVRVLGPWMVPGWTPEWLYVAGACWSVAFFVYLCRYFPFLTSPRADGKPG